jgi:hypothetical protein
MGPSAASPLAALLMGSGVNALQPAQPYGPGLGAVFAQSLLKLFDGPAQREAQRLAREALGGDFGNNA